MVADTAISVTENGGKPLLSVISWRADTFTNVSAGAVYVNDIQVLDARFPSLNSAQESKMKERARQLYPTITFTIGLPSMIASLEKVNEPRAIDRPKHRGAIDPSSYGRSATRGSRGPR